nr:sugar transferase [Flavobacteriales bacterium]
NELLARALDPEKAYVEEVLPAKLTLDLHYVRERDFLLDLRIITATVAKVFGGWGGTRPTAR